MSKGFVVYGNSGAYVMPGSPVFSDRDAALSYIRAWWPDNRHVIVGPKPKSQGGQAI